MRCLSLLVLAGVGGISSTAYAGLPLEHTSVFVEIRGPVAELTMIQSFRNELTDFMEATYTFPLHEDSAVDGAALRIGQREIQASIAERGEARATYEKAVADGKLAAITEQQRPNLFTQSVGNIGPGEEVQVVLHMVQPLAYEDGVYRFDLPLVVGPRFVGAGDVPQVASLVSPVAQGDTGHRVDIEIDIEMGLELAEVRSPSHTDLDLEYGADSAWVSASSLRATRDFVLEIDPDTDRPQASFLAQDGHFSLLLEPPAFPEPEHVVPRELVFVVDNSCSMSGAPMSAAKKAMLEALDGLLPDDTFQVLRFSERASALSPTPLPATSENIAAGVDYVKSMRGMGGTHMLSGIRAALEPEADPTRKRIVCFMTDGYIGNEREILAAIEDIKGESRLFAFGIGSSVNRFLLDRMADSGRGTVTYVAHDQNPTDAVQDFYARIARPVLTDIELDFGDMVVDDLQPMRLPDLFAGQPLRVYGRYVGEPGSIRIYGRMGDGAYQVELSPDVVDSGVAIPSAWARAKVRSLERLQNWGEVAEVRDEVLELALGYSLLTQYTSFVAVEQAVRNTGGQPVRIAQALELPDGVTFSEAPATPTPQTAAAPKPAPTRAAAPKARAVPAPVVSSAVSREAMRPGDPLITVDAMPDARQVLAILPWGEVARLRWDEVRERWFHRFLVPRGVEEGAYTLRVVVVMPDGSVLEEDQELQIDATAPELDAVAEQVGALVRVHVTLEEPLRELQAFPVGQPERRVRLKLEGREDGTVELQVPGTWTEVVVVAKDIALNRVEQVVLVGGAR